MKIKELEKYLMHTGVEDVEVDASEWIGHDEFYNRGGSGDHRERTIDRLVSYKIPFGCNANTAFNIPKRFIIIVCPYCGNHMEYNNGSGSGTESHVHYICKKCHSFATLTVINDNGIYFEPPKK